MKNLFLLAVLFATLTSSAQKANTIESKLGKAFSKIHYWSFYGKDADNAYDSLETANEAFQKLLLSVTAKDPETLSVAFQSLKDSGLHISTSEDGNFRIYSWDTWTGGTMHFYRNVYQFKANGKVYSKTLITLAEYNDGDPDRLYYDIKQVTSNKKNFYLAFSFNMFSSGLYAYNIKVLSIDGDELNDNAKLIKTKTGLKNNLGYEVDLTVSANRDKDTEEIPDYEIQYNNTTKIISIPLILGNNEVTKKRIRYKFNGTYFEKI